MSTTTKAMSATVRKLVEEFAYDLQWELRTVGDPSYRTLARALGSGFSIATLSRKLRGQQFPGWEFVETLLTYCRLSPEVINGDWNARWVDIQNMIYPIPHTPNNPGTKRPKRQQGRRNAKGVATAAEPLTAPLPGSECSECGLLMGNPDRHAEWHDLYVPRPRAVRALPGTSNRTRNLAG